MSLTWCYITVKNQNRKVQVDTGADSTVMSSFSAIELDKLQLEAKTRPRGASDSHQMTLLGSIICSAVWNGSKYMQHKIAVV